MHRFSDLFTLQDDAVKTASSSGLELSTGISSTTALRVAALLGALGMGTSLYQNKKQKDQLLAEVRKPQLVSNI